MFSQSNFGSLWVFLDDMIRNRIAFHNFYLGLDSLDECDNNSKRELVDQVWKRRERLPKMARIASKRLSSVSI